MHDRVKYVFIGFCFYIFLQSKDDIDSWPLVETTLYIGVDRDKKPLTRYVLDF